MNRTKQLLGAVSSVALIALSASPAMAAGTTAGDSITNTVSVDFNVGGIAQTAVGDSDTFVVDRKVDVTVAAVDGPTSVSPGSTTQAVEFTVTNNSNDTIDLNLSSVQGTTDNFDTTSVQYYLDDGDGVFGPGDTLVTYLDEIAADQTVTVFVVSDIPVSATNGQTADITLIADAHEAGTVGSLGTELLNSASNTAGVDTVLADIAGPEDLANEGDHSATNSYVVAGALMTVSKTSSIISDPVNGTNNPKAIPGAIVQYCIAVTNAAGAATATDVVVSDVLPADVDYYVTFGSFVDGDAACSGGTAGGSYDSAGHEMTGPLSDIPADTTRSFYFQVTIK